MPLNRGTQKQIAQRFKGNLDYFRKAHYWRRLRLWTILLVCLGGGAVMGFFFLKGPDTIYNPGPISQHHSRFANDCNQCHQPPPKSFAGATLKLTNQNIDQRCEKCHNDLRSSRTNTAGYSFHQPNVVHARSCTACHQEHASAGPMPPPGDVQCFKCHGDPDEMAASAQKGKTNRPSRFDYRPSSGWNVFKAPRPPDGFTAVFDNFATNHPEFRVVADRLRETNTLQFNHHRHLVLTNDIPLVNSQRLDCAFCHQPGPGGAFFQRISYEQNCRACHSLQVDNTNPALRLPHGRAEHVRAFLRSLPTHYAELAQRTNASPEAVSEFVSAQILRLRNRFADGTNLEHDVFFRKRPQATFDGCVKCHEVWPQPVGAPRITPPLMPDRWMTRAHFDHSKHGSVACAKCHDAGKSADTADVIMPSKTACVECHKPNGRAASSCSYCHSYHAPDALNQNDL